MIKNYTVLQSKWLRWSNISELHGNKVTMASLKQMITNYTAIQSKWPRWNKMMKKYKVIQSKWPRWNSVEAGVISVAHHDSEMEVITGTCTCMDSAAWKQLFCWYVPLLEVYVKVTARKQLLPCSDLLPKFKALALLAVTFIDTSSRESGMEATVLFLTMSVHSQPATSMQLPLEFSSEFSSESSMEAVVILLIAVSLHSQNYC